MKLLTAIGTLALISGFALADTVVENGGAPTFTNMPANLATGLGTNTPYWDNHSGDFGGSNTANVGYFLTGTGNFSTNYNPNKYLSGPGSGGTNDAPASFNLVQDTNSLVISLIGVTTGDLTNVFGIYDASKTGAQAVSSEHPLFGPGAISVGSLNNVNLGTLGFSSIGFYLIKGGTAAGTTWFSNSALNTNAGTASTDVSGHQHFALFTTAADANTFYLGTEDWVSNSGEGVAGDFQDIVVKINADAVPEPATFALMGAGLLGLGYSRFRSRKNRA